MFLIDARTLGPEPSGIGVYTRNLLRGIVAADPDQAVTAWVRPEVMDRLPTAVRESAALRLIERSGSPASPGSLWAAGRSADRGGFGVLHVPDVFAPLRGGPPAVVTLHDVIPLVCRGQLARSRKQQLAWVWRRWLKIQCGRAAAVATVSDYSADDIARELGVPREKIAAIHNAVAPPRGGSAPPQGSARPEPGGAFSAAAAAGGGGAEGGARASGDALDSRLRGNDVGGGRKKGVVPFSAVPPPAAADEEVPSGSGLAEPDGGDEPPRSARFVLNVGLRFPYKNVDGLIRAFARMREREPGLADVTLCVVGPNDPRYPQAGAEAARLGLGDAVDFRGYVDHDDLAGLYRTAAVVAVPSFYEGFGLPLAEAMAAGTPVVCSNRASLPEVAGGAALIVDPDDEAAFASALARVLKDPALAADLAQRGRVRAEAFGLAAFGAAYLDLYGRVAAGG